MVLRKVDPPTRIIGRGRILFLPNPFLDLVGCWTERGGRAIFIEAKQTKDHKLGVAGSNSSGITVKQLHSLRVWGAAGAVSAVLWRSPSRTYFLPIETIEVICRKTGLKHIKEEHVPPFCVCGKNDTLNLLSVMRCIYIDPKPTFKALPLPAGRVLN